MHENSMQEYCIHEYNVHSTQQYTCTVTMMHLFRKSKAADIQFPAILNRKAEFQI